MLLNKNKNKFLILKKKKFKIYNNKETKLI